MNNQATLPLTAATTNTIADRPQSVWQLRWRRLARNRVAMLGGLVLILLALFAAGAPLYERLMGVNVNDTNLLNRFAPPSAQHILGTDEAGRDVMARLMYGGRISLLVGLLGAISAAMVGTLIGLIAGTAQLLMNDRPTARVLAAQASPA